MKTRGFTLVELMITLAVSSILLGIAVPSFQSLIINNRISTQTNDLVAELAMARSEAVKRGAKVSLCTSSNGTSCTSSAWSAGRIIFTDTGTAGAIDGSDTSLRVGAALDGGITLVSEPTAIAEYIQYTPTGAVASSGSFTLCKSGYKGRVITISNTGRVSTAETSSNCP